MQLQVYLQLISSSCYQQLAAATFKKIHTASSACMQREQIVRSFLVFGACRQKCRSPTPSPARSPTGVYGQPLLAASDADVSLLVHKADSISRLLNDNKSLQHKQEDQAEKPTGNAADVALKRLNCRVPYKTRYLAGRMQLYVSYLYI